MEIDHMVRIKGDVRKELKESKKYSRETYSEVIKRLLKKKGLKK